MCIFLIPHGLVRLICYLQAKHCYYKYNEFFRCEKFHGKDATECFKFKQAYFSLCPKDWVCKTNIYPQNIILILILSIDNET
jgi:hypothetical protein